MAKIQKVITECHDCEFCKKFQYVKNNYTHAYICSYDADESESKQDPFLLDYIHSKGDSKLVIPENCPLEEYKPTVS